MIEKLAKQIEYEQNNWHFDQVIALKKELANINSQYFTKYLCYLCDCGHLDMAIKAIQNISPAQKAYFNKNEDKTYLRIKKMLLEEIYTPGDKYINSQIKKTTLSALSGDIKSLFIQIDNLIKDFDSAFQNAEQTAKNYMFLSFAIHQLIDAEKLNLEQAKFFSIKLCTAGRNLQRQKHIIQRILQYTSANDYLYGDFYQLPENFYTHIHRILFFLKSHEKENGARIAIDKMFEDIRYHNDLSFEYPKRQLNIAVCISGKCKIDYKESLQKIYHDVVEPLNADVFLHTWDEKIDWVGNTRLHNFWPRTFSIRNESVPTKLQNVNFFKEYFPHTAKTVLRSNVSRLEDDSFNEMPWITSHKIENEEAFMKKYAIGERFKTRGHFNQVKMFYGMYQAYTLMNEYENEHQKKYDFVIKLRVDSKPRRKLRYEEFSGARFDQAYFSLLDDVGLQDVYFYAPRALYEVIVKNFWLSGQANKRVSPLPAFPEYCAHAALTAWIIANDIKFTVIDNISAVTNFVAIKGVNKALIKDGKKLDKNLQAEYQWLVDFFKDKDVEKMHFIDSKKKKSKGKVKSRKKS